MSAKMFEDQVVIVTGGGRGIGAAACRMFVEHGAKVVVSDRDEEPTESNLQAIKDAGGDAIGVAGDVTDAAFPDKLMNAKEDGASMKVGDKEIALGITEGMRGRATTGNPLGRPGTPEEGAGGILMMASPLASSANGHCLEVTGGARI